MKSNANILKLLSLILTGFGLLGGSIWGITMKSEEAKAYTDTKTESLRIEQKADMKELRNDISTLQQDTSVIRTILEERFRGK